jgi:hypothetical protein
MKPPSDMDMHNTIRPVGVLRSVELRSTGGSAEGDPRRAVGRALEQNAHSGRDTAGRNACAQDRHERGGVIVPAGTPPRDVTNERSRRQARQTQAFAAQVRLVGVTSFGREPGKVPTSPRPDPRAGLHQRQETLKPQCPLQRLGADSQHAVPRAGTATAGSR